MIEIAENITSSRNNRSQRLEATNRSISNQPRAPETRNQFTRGHTPLRNCDRFNRTSQRLDNSRRTPRFSTPNQGRGYTPQSNNDKGFTPCTHTTPQPQQHMSKEERAQLLASGKCFHCKEEGHMACNCPKQSTVRSTSTRPPGLQTFHIEIEGEESESIDSDYIFIHEDLSVGMISLEPTDKIWDLIKEHPYEQWHHDYDPKAPQQQVLGNAIELGAQNALETEVPYPGDAPFPIVFPTYDERRFHVIYSPFHIDSYYIFDLNYQCYELLSGEILRHRTFRIGEWYADICQYHMGTSDRLRPHSITMGDDYGYNAELVLRSGISELYPT